MDRIRVQVQFKKFLWKCPKCGQEDITDANVGGENTYEHDCSACAAHFNQSGPNMTEYNSTLNYSPEEYEKLSAKELSDTKDAKLSEWDYERKNPPVYEEPTVEVLEQLKAEKQAEIDNLNLQITAKTAKVIKEK